MIKNKLFITDGPRLAHLLFFLIAIYILVYILKPKFFNSIYHLVELLHVWIIAKMNSNDSLRIVDEYRENVVCFVGGFQLPITRKYLNLSSYLSLIVCLSVLPTKLKVKFVSFVLGFFILFFINLQRIQFVIHQSFMVQHKIPALDLTYYRLLAELIPILAILGIRLYDRLLFLKIKKIIWGFKLKNYTIFLFIVTYYLATILSDLFISIKYYPLDWFVNHLTSFYLFLSRELLLLFDYHTTFVGKRLFGLGRCVQMDSACLGLKMMAFYALFIILFRGEKKWMRILKYISIGFSIFFILNVFRVAGLWTILVKFGTIYFYYTDHHEIFNFVIYVSMLVMCLFWTRKFKD